MLGFLKTTRSFPKIPEDVRSLPKSAKRELAPSAFTWKIRDREEGIAIYSFYTWISFLTWVWVNIFLEIVSSRTATTHIFQSGVRNWPAGVSRREIEVFNPQAWELAGILPSLQFSNFYRWTTTVYERKVWNQVQKWSKVIRNFSARGDEVRICLWLSGDPEFHESIRLNAYTSLKRRHLNSMRPIFTGKSSRKYCNVYLTMHDNLEVF